MPAVLSSAGAFVKTRQLLLVRANALFLSRNSTRSAHAVSERNTILAVCKDENRTLNINFQQLLYLFYK